MLILTIISLLIHQSSAVGGIGRCGNTYVLRGEEKLVVVSLPKYKRKSCTYKIQAPVSQNVGIKCVYLNFDKNCIHEDVTISTKGSRISLCDSSKSSSKRLLQRFNGNKITLRHSRNKNAKKDVSFICELFLYSKNQTDDTNECGKLDISVPRVVGGVEADPHEYPFMVRIKMFHDDAGRFASCGASVISNKWILSAAHCFQSNYQRVDALFGKHHIKITEESQLIMTIPKENIFPHESYSSSTFENDIALLKLPNKLKFNDYIKPICLASTETKLETNKAITTGWGLTSFFGDVPEALQEVTLDVIPNSVCVEMYKDVFGIYDDMICAYTSGKDSCQGDSGGPLIQQGSDSIWYQVGVVSFGDGCAKIGAPGVYSRVEYMWNWINNITKIDL